MGLVQMEGKMEGWLYTIRSNRFGLQFSRKRYFSLEEHNLKCYKTIPVSKNVEPVRSAIIDSCIRVTDNGRVTVNRKVFFIFTLYSTLNHHDRLKLGANSSEDAARWIRSLQSAVLKECPNPAKDFVSISHRKWPPLRLRVSKRISHKRSIECSTRFHADAMTSDVIAPSPWKIFGCQNGLRLFKEAKDWGSNGGRWDDHPAIMAVGVVDGTCEAIFQTLMSLGSSRSEWDFCFYKGSVVEELDGHTDIVHKQLYNEWLPWGMKPRDLLMRRYWRREEDGTYVILYHSVIHKKCTPQKGYIRACLKSGGYVITPSSQENLSLVKHMLAVDWKFWKLYLRPSSARSITIRMLERVAALRELFRAKSGNYHSEFSSSGNMQGHVCLPETEIDDAKVKDPGCDGDGDGDGEADKSTLGFTNLVSLNDASDEFFDVPDAIEFFDLDHLDNGWSSEPNSDLHALNIKQSKLSSKTIVKKLHDFAVQKKGYLDLQELIKEDDALCYHGDMLQKDSNCALPCSWSTADPTTFLIRGENYLKDHHKIKAKGTLMQMVGADWLRSDQREDDLGGRPNSVVQKFAAQGRSEFFFIVNIQVPGSTTYSLALYYMLKTPLEETPLVERFVSGDDMFRNSRFKLIPYISKGSWIVKQSVGKKACLVGQALEVNYFHGKNYLELGIDVGSSTVARGVVSLVLGYLNNLVIEMAFLIQGDVEEELPEFLIGTCRLNCLDASKSVHVLQ